MSKAIMKRYNVNEEYVIYPRDATIKQKLVYAYLFFRGRYSTSKAWELAKAFMETAPTDDEYGLSLLLFDL